MDEHIIILTLTSSSPSNIGLKSPSFKQIRHIESHPIKRDIIKQYLTTTEILEIGTTQFRVATLVFGLVVFFDYQNGVDLITFLI